MGVKARDSAGRALGVGLRSQGLRRSLGTWSVCGSRATGLAGLLTRAALSNMI